MRSLTVIAIPIYRSLSERYPNMHERSEATKQYILNEVTHWTIKSLEQSQGYFFKPKEFSGDKKSSPFEIRLVKSDSKSGAYELKFADLNAATDEEKYHWNDKDPYRLQKALFLRNVLQSKVVPMLKNQQIDSIIFTPYDRDGLGDDRYSYFYNMYSKLAKEEFDLDQPEANTYVITRK